LENVFREIIGILIFSCIKFHSPSFLFIIFWYICIYIPLHLNLYLYTYIMLRRDAGRGRVYNNSRLKRPPRAITSDKRLRVPRARTYGTARIRTGRRGICGYRFRPAGVVGPIRPWKRRLFPICRTHRRRIRIRVRIALHTVGRPRCPGPSPIVSRRFSRTSESYSIRSVGRLRLLSRFLARVGARRRPSPLKNMFFAAYVIALLMVWTFFAEARTVSFFTRSTCNGLLREMFIVSSSWSDCFGLTLDGGRLLLLGLYGKCSGCDGGKRAWSPRLHPNIYTGDSSTLYFDRWSRFR